MNKSNITQLNLNRQNTNTQSYILLFYSLNLVDDMGMISWSQLWLIYNDSHTMYIVENIWENSRFY